MRILTNTWSNNSDYNADCSYAVVDIGEEFAKRILEKRDLFLAVSAKVDRALDLRFLSNPVTWLPNLEEIKQCFDPSVDLEAFEASMEMDVAYIISDEGELPDGQRIDVGVLHVDEDHFYWVATPKHSTIEITTVAIRYEILNENGTRS